MASHQADSVCYTLINVQTDRESFHEQNLKNDLEKGDIKQKTESLKKLIQMILNGEKFPSSMLMTIIRFVLPCQDHLMKKLLLIFWEIVPKRGPDGKLLHEMILVCDAYRKDLQHPNEYIRGSTLRFLCKLQEPELIEPLMTSIRGCLDHRHSYVRRNAVLAIFKIYINFESLIPDAPELILDFLSRETDASCKRNAFLMLIHLDQVKALEYLNSCLDQIASFNDILQLVIVELIYKVCIANPSERSKFIRAIYNLLSISSSASVRYEAAATLITLSQAPTALHAAAACFIDICLKESDNNIKLIVLDRLVALKESTSGAERVLQDSLMDILRVLNVSSDLEVKQKILGLTMELVTSRNVEEVVQILKKEIIKIQNESMNTAEETSKYRQSLVLVLHKICLKHPDFLVADKLVETLLELLSADDKETALRIISFNREFIVKHPQHKTFLLSKLLEVFSTVKNSAVHQGLLWILGEFAEPNDPEFIKEILATIRACIGEIPIVASELRKNENENENENFSSGKPLQQRKDSSKLVTADGLYVTQSALSTPITSQTDRDIPLLRAHFLSGQYFVATALANCLLKLALKFKESKQTSAKVVNKFFAECMLILTSILHVGKVKLNTEEETNNMINEDDFERVSLCLMMLGNLNNDSSNLYPLMKQIFLNEMRNSIISVLSVEEEKEGKKDKKKERRFVEVDDHLNFSQLANKSQEMFENQFEISLSQAIGGNVGPTATSTTYGKSSAADLLSTSKLSKVTQLTGFSDPIFAECFVNVNQFDVCLDVLIVNLTSDVLQNCTLEIYTMGDLKLVEKPQPIVLGPYDFSNVKATVKVASTESAAMFGNIVYDVSGSTSDRNIVVLNDINIDVVDYMIPASCPDLKFRNMWAAFEWENKVLVNTHICELGEYLKQLSEWTNMKCLTPPQALSGDCSFLAANLYAKSIFGEDALLNISIEKSSPDGPVTGHLRIRAKSQGMALSLGDKINKSQKMPKAG